MQLVSSWSHYLEFRCDDCGETVHVDAAQNFPSEVECRSDSCRNSTQQPEAVVVSNRSAQIETPTVHRRCR